jgi:hypothetical protein
VTTTVYPSGYLAQNKQRAKQLNVVVQIAGVPQTFSMVPIYEKVRYGDPRLVYGAPGLRYGGLIEMLNVMSILQLDGGLNITQQIEPEQGRGSVATLSLKFIDKSGYMSQVISPGVIITEPLGNTLVTVSVGYANSDFPGSYYKVFRGYISKASSVSGVVTLELSDANIKRRQQIFLGGTSSLSAPINSSQTNIPVTNPGAFIQQILGPAGTYDGSVTTYIKVDDEYMTYDHTGIGSGVINVLSRGGSNSRGTTPATHAAGATVTNSVQLQGNVIDLALKIMLSGWNGPWLTGVPVAAVGTSLDVTNPQPSAVIFPPGIDAVEDYGLTVGDYVTLSGDTLNPSNNGTYTIADIQDDLGDTNRMIILSAPLAVTNPGTGVQLAFRSQYDTLPVSCGLSNTPQEIDVETHQGARALFFSAGFYTQQVAVLDCQAGENGKDLIESKLWLPVGVYSITRYGRVSVAVTKPPIAGSSLVYLDASNITNPSDIRVERALNTRRFYNVVQFNYDLRDDGSYGNQANLVDSDSLTKIKVPSVLPINADGAQSSLGAATMVQARGLFILNRYKRAAYEITLKVNWSAASLIEVGDVVALVDNGTLKITNFETGKRDLGTQLYEVIQRNVNVKEGNAELVLLSSIGYTLNQRFATIAPSSIVDVGSTTTSVRVKDSFGVAAGGEPKKWSKLVGLPIVVHDPLWTRQAQVTFTGYDSVDKYRLLVSPALPWTPSPGDLVDIAPYGTGTSKAVNATYKTLYAFLVPSLTVVTGISNTQFTLSAPDAANLPVGSTIYIHDATYATVSAAVKVTSVVGTTVTVASSLGFTPSAGQLVENANWLDGGGPYLFL